MGKQTNRNYIREIEIHCEQESLNQKLRDLGFEDDVKELEVPLYKMHRETKELDMQKDEMTLKVDVGKLAKAAAVTAAGVATGGVGAVALTATMADSLKNFEINPSYSNEKVYREKSQHFCDDGKYVFIEANYSVESVKVGFMCFATSEVKVKGSLYVTYMEGKNASGMFELSKLTGINADATMSHIRTAIKNGK